METESLQALSRFRDIWETGNNPEKDEALKVLYLCIIDGNFGAQEQNIDGESCLVLDDDSIVYFDALFENHSQYNKWELVRKVLASFFDTIKMNNREKIFSRAEQNEARFLAETIQILIE